MDQKRNTKVWLIFIRLMKMASEEEKRRFDEMIVPGSKEERLFYELSEKDDYQRRRNFIAGIDVEKELDRVKKSRKRFSLRSVISWRVAVIVLPMLLGMFLAYQLYKGKHPILAIASELGDVEPGTLGAVLVLSDGTLRELLTVPNNIKEQDGSHIKADSGRLDYLGRESFAEKGLIYNKLLVGRGHEYMLVLHDGTKVWMNSKSELHYPVVFGSDIRHVKLSGEAYFEVIRDSSRPFVVEVDRGFEVKVLGTRFNIKAYDTDDRYETTLVDGKVQINQPSGEEIVLEPSEQMVIGQDGKCEVRVVNTSYYVAWHEGWFYFDNEPLEQVLNMVGRWYDIEFNLSDDELKAINVTGKVKRFEKLNVILDMLTKITRVQFDVYDKKVTVMK